VPESAAEILRYFWLHPERVDDLESVVRWRLLEETIHRHIEDIRESLKWLVAEGFLVQEAIGPSGSVFRLNRDQAVATERFLNRVGRRGRSDKRGDTRA